MTMAAGETRLDGEGAINKRICLELDENGDA
jgi:hypothetical protein